MRVITDPFVECPACHGKPLRVVHDQACLVQDHYDGPCECLPSKCRECRGKGRVHVVQEQVYRARGGSA